MSEPAGRASDVSPIAGLSVIIVCWNAASAIESCLRSLIDHAPDRLYEIVLLDNASSDASVDRAWAFGRNVRIVELERNLGFAGACNEGYRRSRGDYLLFLNSDIEAEPSALEILCRFMDEHPDAAAAGGKLLGEDGAPQKGFNVRAFPSLKSAAFEILMIDKIFPWNRVSRRQRMLDFPSYETDEVAEVDQPAGACLLVRRSAFEAAGLFDEQFHPAWFEDVDLCLRLHELGSKIWFVPQARFRHRGGLSLEHLEYRQFLSYFYRNRIRYFSKHHGKSAGLVLRALTLVGMLERIVAGLVAPKEGVTKAEALAAYWRVLWEAI